MSGIIQAPGNTTEALRQLLNRLENPFAAGASVGIKVIPARSSAGLLIPASAPSFSTRPCSIPGGGGQQQRA
jgi:hypothetical protein